MNNVLEIAIVLAAGYFFYRWYEQEQAKKTLAGLSVQGVINIPQSNPGRITIGGVPVF